MTGAFAIVEFASGPFLWAGLAALPVIVFFLLRRRLKDEVLSTTMLWQRALEESPARASWRRPNEWLSLLLLLIAIAAATLAAADFRIGVDRSDAGRTIVVIDVSASMSTVESGTSRLEKARIAARGVVDGIRAGKKVELIASGMRPRVVSHMSDDEGALRAALDAIAIEPTTGDLRTAIELAYREATHETNAGASIEIVCLSDFAEANSVWKDLPESPARLRFVRIGGEVPNAGIVQTAAAGEGEQPVLVATIAANATADLSRRVVLSKNGVVVDAVDVTVGAGKHAGAVFKLPVATDRTSVDWTIELEPRDAMTLDDVAYFTTTPRPPARVLLIGEADPFLDRLPDVFPGIDVQRVAAASLAAVDAVRPFDLVIITEKLSGPPPAAARELWIGVIPDDIGVRAVGQLLHPVLLDADSQSPLLRGVDFEELEVVAATALELPTGARALVRVAGGVALAEVPLPARDVLLWASGVLESNWMLIPAFPLVVRNLLGTRLAATAIDARRTDQPLHVPAGLDVLSGNVSLTAQSPAGEVEASTLWSREEYFWSRPLCVGHYGFRAHASKGDGEAAFRIGMNLFSDLETTTGPTTPDVHAASVPADVTDLAHWHATASYWRLLIGIAALALLLEIALWWR